MDDCEAEGFQQSAFELLMAVVNERLTLSNREGYDRTVFGRGDPTLAHWQGKREIGEPDTVIVIASGVRPMQS